MKKNKQKNKPKLVKPNEKYFEGRGNLKFETESLRVFEPTENEKETIKERENDYEIEIDEGKNKKTKLILTGFTKVLSKIDNKPVVLFKFTDTTMKYYAVTKEGEEMIKKVIYEMKAVFPFIEIMDMKDYLPNVINAMKFSEKLKD